MKSNFKLLRNNEMQVLSPDQFADHRKYNPYGRNTGRGSGVHRVMSRSDR
jgi:hypothetical protein